MRQIPIHTAVFIHAVNNGQDIPETSFCLSSSSSARRVEMVLVDYGLHCRHAGKEFIVPVSNIKFLIVLADNKEDSRKPSPK